MRKLGDLLNRLVIAAGILVAVAVLLVGRTAVDRHYDYREMTAPKSLHQLSQETRAGADEDGRGHLMLYGAGLAALALVGFGVMLFAMYGGREFGRRAGRKTRRRPSPAARSQADPPPLVYAEPLRRLPAAPTLPQLPEGAHDGRP